MYKVYLIKNLADNQYKIGYTRRSVEQRIREFKTGNCNELKVIHEFESKWGTKIEATLHRRFKWKKIQGEWFDLEKYEVDNFINECQKLHQNFEILSQTNSFIIEKGFK